MARAPRFLHTGRRLCVALAALGTGTAALASSDVACVLATRVQQLQVQPLSEWMARVQVKEVRDDNTQRNDVECSKHFRSGSSLWVSLNARKFKNRSQPGAGSPLWLSFRYGDDRNGAVWRRWEVLTEAEYMERKNGIQ